MKTTHLTKNKWANQIIISSKNIAIFFFTLCALVACVDEKDELNISSPESVIWTFENGLPITSHPISTGEFVLLEQDGTVLQNIDAESGKIVWSFQGVTSDFGKPGRSFRVPLVTNGIVYWAMGLARIYAIELTTGKKIWEYNASTRVDELGRPTDSFTTPPVYNNNKLYVLTYNKRLLAIDTSNGELIWENNTITGQLCPKLIIANNKVIVTDGGNFNKSRVKAFNGDTGEQVWYYETPNQLNMYLFNDDQCAFIKDGVTVKGLEIETGDVLYECNTNLVDGKLIFASPKYFYMNNDKRVYAFDKEQKKEIWNHQTAEDILLIPATYGNYLYFGDTEYLYALEKNSGKLVWEIHLNKKTSQPNGPIEIKSFITTPAVNEQFVYTVHYDILYAIKR